jgi:hypothetical protein
MLSLRPGLTDKEYWDLRLKLLELQRDMAPNLAAYAELRRDFLDDLHNYLILQVEEQDPWS